MTRSTCGCPSSQRAICERALGVALHPDGERLQAAQHQVAVERGGDAAGGVLDEAEPLGERVVARHRRAADHVGVAVQVLGRRVDDEVGPELQRPLEVRGGEGVVDDRDGAARAGQLRHRRDVGDLEERVGGALDPDEPRRGLEGPLHGREVGHVDLVEARCRGAGRPCRGSGRCRRRRRRRRGRGRPAWRRWRTASLAASPEAKAKPWRAPSSAA